MVIGSDWIIAGLCASSAGLTAIACRHAPHFATAVRLIDKPDGVRKVHEKETPLFGGPAVLVPSLLVSLLFISISGAEPTDRVAVLACMIALVVGALDDRTGLTALWRLATFTLVILGVFWSAPSYVLHSLWFSIFDKGVGIPLGPFAGPVIALAILGFINAVNMADGINGQLLGSIIVWCAFITYYQGVDLGLPFIAVACSSLVALYYNLRGRLFMGSSGAYAAALLIALGSIATYRHAGGRMPAEVPLYWFWLPVTDCLRLMVSRPLSGHSPFAADRNHFHHMLLDHMRVRYALAIYLALMAAPGAATLVSHTWGGIVLIACMSGYAAFIVAKSRTSKRGRAAAPDRITALASEAGLAQGRGAAHVMPRAVANPLQENSSRTGT